MKEGEEKMKKHIVWGLCAVALALAANTPSAHAQWCVHTTVHDVVEGEDLTTIAMRYVNTNTPLKVYREMLVELNYDILRERDGHEVLPGDALRVNYWVDE